MHKKNRILISLLLLLSLSLSLLIPAFAEEEKTEELPNTELHISSLSGFLSFSKNCVRDRYSQNLTVYLDTNLDLANADFHGIPIFCGTFAANGHTIEGLNLTEEGSNLGLFRYLAKDAQIKDLTVKGTILPEGSQNRIGGIVGNNAGSILNCSFSGTVSGCEAVGGIAGRNQVSGLIENCQVKGMVSGAHFVGGIAGENMGILRSVKNFSDINVNEEDNNIHTIQLTPEFLTGKESAETVTDLGGIAGTTTGVIRDCTNTGTVGYPHMGYNIGGIAGSQRGYITQCKNLGKISGRKEVGGIAGQMEPVANISYTPDTLQILRGQLATTSSLANRASADIRGGSESIGYDINALHEEAGVAMDAVIALLESGGDYDSIIAANNALSGSIGSMQNIASSLHGTIEATVSTAAGDIQALTRQVTAMSHTLDTAADNLGGTVTDVSDQDTDEDYSAKVSLCENHGTVLGDLNVGGITGAIAWENDKDPEGDFEISGDRSLNFDSKLRAVILKCKNYETVTAKKRNAGGIAGNMTMGLVKDCINTGFLDCENADYLGGITGIGNGFIRSCSSKTRIRGGSYIGGIAGQAPILTDCRSMVKIADGSEWLGSIVGKASEYRELSEEEVPVDPIANNFYLPLSHRIGAIDGIDYYGVADSMSKQEFLKLPDLPQIFAKATMVFRFPDGTSKTLVVPLGQVVPESKIPELPQRNGYIASWDQLEEVDLNNVFLDGTLEVIYTPCHSVVESYQTREDGKPVLLAEGSFRTADPVSIHGLQSLPQKAVEGWSLPEITQDTVLHLSCPDTISPKYALVMVQNAEGTWRDAEVSENGSYLVFHAGAGDQAVAVRESGARMNTILILCTAVLLILILTTLLVVRHHRKQLRKRK